MTEDNKDTRGVYLKTAMAITENIKQEQKQLFYIKAVMSCQGMKMPVYGYSFLEDLPKQLITGNDGFIATCETIFLFRSKRIMKKYVSKTDNEFYYFDKGEVYRNKYGLSTNPKAVEVKNELVKLGFFK